MTELTDKSIRTYNRNESIVFFKTKDNFGGLSNMAGGFPVFINDTKIFTVEALYQACRYPHSPEIQKRIIDAKSPMTAKMISKSNLSMCRSDWMQVRVQIMRWCLRIKLSEHWKSFGNLLLDSEDKPIVELSFKDDFWGAKPTGEFNLVGMNVLGRLLMEAREMRNNEQNKQNQVPKIRPPEITDFYILGKKIS